MSPFEDRVHGALLRIADDPQAALRDLEMLYGEAAEQRGRRSMAIVLRALCVCAKVAGKKEALTRYELRLAELIPSKGETEFWRYDPVDPHMPLKARFIDVVRDVEDPKTLLLELARLRRRAIRAGLAQLATICLEGLARNALRLGDARRAHSYARRFTLESPTAEAFNSLASLDVRLGKTKAARKHFGAALTIAADEGDLDQAEIARSALATLGV